MLSVQMRAMAPDRTPAQRSPLNGLCVRKANDTVPGKKYVHMHLDNGYRKAHVGCRKADRKDAIEKKGIDLVT